MIEIRIAQKSDAQDILNIYAHYVEQTNITFEYVVPSLLEMETRIQKTLQDYPYLVAMLDHQIVGYAYASRYATRKAYDWDCELSIYVSSSHHLCGIGQQLYQAMFLILEKMNVQNVYACITHPNEKSESFHQKLGFQSVGIFHQCGYKFEKWHDVIWMEKRIGKRNQVKEIIPFSLLIQHVM